MPPGDLAPLQFGDPRHIPSREAPVLELVPVHTAAIRPQQANKLIKLLAAKAPMDELGHLKRIAKRSQLKGLAAGGEGGDAEGPCSLQVILCRATGEAGEPTLPAAVREVVEEQGLETSVVQVSRHSPTTRAELDEWGAFWPITWRPPDPHLASASGLAAAAASAPSPAAMEGHMRACFELLLPPPRGGRGEPGRDGEGGCNAALIVDPATNAVVGAGLDGTGRHPLLHAVMAAIEAAADRDRRLWPGGATQQQQQQQPQDGAHGAADEAAAGATKRRRTGEGPGAPQGEPPACPPASKPYLCTGFHCYVIAEPCAMCAMALVHSRVARVIYCRQDTAHGALGGAFKMHQQRSLNHHYEAYHLPLLNPQPGGE